MAKFRAIRDGLVGASYIHEGEIFELDVKKCPGWAEPVKEPETKAKSAPKKQNPENEKQGED